MRIIINENQLRLLNEEGEINQYEGISYDLKESIAIWCLLNDFRYIITNNSYGNEISTANVERINKEICNDIMRGTLIDATEEKELFGYNDYDDFEDGDDERDEYTNGNKIYKVLTNEEEEFYIEVPENISEHDCDIMIQDLIDGEISEFDDDYKLVRWFYRMYK